MQSSDHNPSLWIATTEDHIGVALDGDQLHTRSAVCTHLGCLVTVNNAERSWDCPCHGSRFSIDRTELEGPAGDDLAVREG